MHAFFVQFTNTICRYRRTFEMNKMAHSIILKKWEKFERLLISEKSSFYPSNSVSSNANGAFVTGKTKQLPNERNHKYLPLAPEHRLGGFVLSCASEFVAFSEFFYSIYRFSGCFHSICRTRTGFGRMKCPMWCGPLLNLFVCGSCFAWLWEWCFYTDNTLVAVSRMQNGSFIDSRRRCRRTI